MANAVGKIDMFTNGSSVVGGDIESGSMTEQASNATIKEPQILKTSEKMKGVTNSAKHNEDIDKWVGSIERIMKDVPLYMCSQGHPGRISRIPDNLREVDIKGYEPYILSFGPYHNGKPRVQPMENRKKLVLKCVLERKPELILCDYLKEIASIEQMTRSFYSDVEMDSEKFVQMLLVDSVYLLTIFCGMPKGRGRMNEKNEGKDSVDDTEEDRKLIAIADEFEDEVKSGDTWYWNWFAHDLFLLENQLPFFLLLKMYNFVYGGSETELIHMVKYGVIHLLTNYMNLDAKMVISQTEEVHHVLHLCHMLLRPTLQQESMACNFPESSHMFRLGSAMQLYEAGVNFEARSDSIEYSLLDITFDGSGKMAMPCLNVDDNTESLLRNLIAVEQMKYPSLGLNISAFVVLLLHLVTTPNDVELLRRKGIIQHHLPSDKEMMYLVNRLSVGLAFDYVEDRYCLKPVFQELKRYSERRVPQWRAWLKHRHFSNPWTTISLLVASVILILNIVQTYYAVYSYYFPCCDAHQ